MAGSDKSGRRAVADHAAEGDQASEAARPPAQRARRRRETPDPAADHEPRRPRQERGQRRVDAILDAAAGIIAESGVAGMTIHGVAKHSRTAIGSMYHFFPDRDCVLDALRQRHADAIRGIASGLLADDSVDWGTLPTAEVVDRFVDPFLDYMDSHRDLTALMRGMPRDAAQRQGSVIEEIVLELLGTIVGARAPAIGGPERTAVAMMVLAVQDGAAARIARLQGAPARAVRRELKRNLVAYLDAIAG